MILPSLPSTAALLSTSERADSDLAHLIGELTDRLQAGEPVELDAVLAENAEHAERIRELWPALTVIAHAGRSHDGSPAPGGPIDASRLQGVQSLGEYRLVRELGRGGMGIVYEAEQLSLGRKVALKVLPFAGLLDKRQLARFHNEARAAATLSHPNIVPVYAVGEDRGVHYYAMQLIRGASLAEVIAALRVGPRAHDTRSGRPAGTDVGSAFPAAEPADSLPAGTAGPTQALAALSTEHSTNPQRYFRRVAEIGIHAAQALQHAHASGILHRDVKPANVLLDDEGKPWITDFGLARIEAESRLSVTGDLVGTLRYMPPEQIVGGGIHDHRSDIYSLGATLYEAAALRPVFDDEHREMLLKQITTAEPRPLRAINPATPAELETILLKAIEKDPTDRYATAADLAADLRRFLADQPIHARRPSLAAHARKWARRHPSQLLAATLALAVCFVAALAAFGVASIERERTAGALAEKTEAVADAQEQRDRANEERRRAEDERQRAIDSLKLARGVVDSMYLKLGTQWIADETAPSMIQRGILEDAAKFYRQLAETPIEGSTDLSELSLASSGYGRIGIIEHYLQNYEEAVAARRQTVAVIRRARSIDPRNTDISSDLVYEHHQLGQSLVELARYEEAIDAYEEGAKLARELIEAEIDPIKHRFYLARMELARAAVLAQTGSRAEAGRLARTAKEELEAVFREVDDKQWFWREVAVERFRAAYWLAKILACEGAVEEAAEICQETLDRCRRWRSVHEQQVARSRALEIELLELSAELAEVRGDLPAAEQQYRRVLDMRRESLRAGLAPERFFMEAFFKNSMNMDGLIEPGPFVGYVETHLRLADVLRRAGRPYAAEDILGECMTVTAAVVAERPNALRYRIADANTWALAAELLADRRPTDAETAYRRARQLWTETIQQFPHAKRYVSGIHGFETDWERFQSISHLFIHVPAKGAKMGVDTRETVLHLHSTGRAWARAGLWENAIPQFKQSAALRTTDHAYDWLQIAMAHAELGEHEEAQAWLDKATEASRRYEPPNRELVELLEDAKDRVEQRRDASEKETTSRG